MTGVDDDQVRRRPSGVVFDLDGVLVDTAGIHARAWKEAFDRFLSRHGDDEPFSMDDYRAYVDGRPRYQGVSAFLESRGIELPAGSPSDVPGMTSEAALGNFKNQLFLDLIDEVEVRPLPGVEDLLDALQRGSTPMAVVSSSRNTGKILPPGLAQRVDLVLGGTDLDEFGLPGKPEPDMFVKAARDLGLTPGRVAVVEDSGAGVVAGRRGGFALVVGVVARDDRPSLMEWADITVAGVGDLPPDVPSWSNLLEAPPMALDHVARIRERVEVRGPLYVGVDEGEQRHARMADGVGVVVDRRPSPMTWADFHVLDDDARRELLALLDTDQLD